LPGRGGLGKLKLRIALSTAEQTVSKVIEIRILVLEIRNAFSFSTKKRGLKMSKDSLIDFKNDFFVDLIKSMRKEIRSQKQIRNSLIILKFIFLKLALASMILNVTKMLNIDYAFTILSLTVVYLDLIACQKVMAIKRVGLYFRERIEPFLDNLQENDTKSDGNGSKCIEHDFYFWETYLVKDKLFYKKSMLWTMISCNILLASTLLVLSFIFELFPEISFEAVILMCALGICFILDVVYNLKGVGVINREVTC
jgi:hypothetical protein